MIRLSLFRLATATLLVTATTLAGPALAQSDARERWLAKTPQERAANVDRARARWASLTPDRREDVREWRRERRDLREDRRDATYQGGWRDRREDYRERRREWRDRREDRFDRRF
jgi:hypothetical protein